MIALAWEFCSRGRRLMWLAREIGSQPRRGLRETSCTESLMCLFVLGCRQSMMRLMVEGGCLVGLDTR